jgi:hypothetical protein
VIKASVPDCCLWYGILCDPAAPSGSSGAGGPARGNRERRAGGAHESDTAGKGKATGDDEDDEDAGGVITGIHLPGNSLVGSLPADFGMALPRLEHVDLAQNNLTGTIPTTITGRPRAAGSRLRDLVLYDNMLEGGIPHCLRSARRLRRLILASNFLQGHIPPWLGELSQLEMLIINDNALEGTIPPALSNLTKLSHLYLQNNKLHGRVPPELIADPETAPKYLFVNGNAQPTRLSFDEVEEEKKAVHTRVRSHRLLDEMVEQEVEEEAGDEDETHRRYRKRKVREHKARMVQKVKEAYAGTRRATGLEDFARGRGITGPAEGPAAGALVGTGGRESEEV